MVRHRCVIWIWVFPRRRYGTVEHEDRGHEAEGVRSKVRLVLCLVPSPTQVKSPSTILRNCSYRSGTRSTPVRQDHRQRLDLGPRSAPRLGPLHGDQARGRRPDQVDLARRSQVQHRVRADRHRQRRDGHDGPDAVGHGPSRRLDGGGADVRRQARGVRGGVPGWA